MPNTEYDTLTPEEKKKLMKGRLYFDIKEDLNGEDPQTGVREDDGRGVLHRHLA